MEANTQESMLSCFTRNLISETHLRLQGGNGVHQSVDGRATDSRAIELLKNKIKLAINNYSLS